MQHLAALPLRQLHAVHPAAVQPLEQVGAGDAGEGEEGQALAAAQLQGLLGDPTQHLPSRQVAQVPGVSVGDQVLGVLLPDLNEDGTAVIPNQRAETTPPVPHRFI